MLKILGFFAAFFLFAHGLVHLLGTAVYLNHAEIKNFAYKTTVLGGRWELGDFGMRIFGSLWVLPAMGFAVAALALAAGWGWWKPALVSATLLSLLLTTLDWNMAFMGAVIDMVILAALAIAAPIVAYLA